MTRIGIYWNSGKAHALNGARQLMALLEAKGVQPVPEAALAQALGLPGGMSCGELAASCGAMIVLGGDGTLLSAAEPAARCGVPLLGVNMGHMGFMAEVTPEGMPYAVERLCRGDYMVEERMMICARCEGMDEKLALNDIVLCRPGDELHIVETHVSVGGASMGRIKSDGLIISTPTGSTAYSLSAGGPVVDPELDCILVTPICPHSPLSRPAVLPPWQTLCIETPADGMELTLSADSRAPVRLPAGSVVTVCRSELRARFIRFENRSFYDAFRMKISEWSN